MTDVSALSDARGDDGDEAADSELIRRQGRQSSSEETGVFTYQLSLCVSGAILISFFSFSVLRSAPHPLTSGSLDAIGAGGCKPLT